MPTKRLWRTSKREFETGERPLVMGILNVTPDSFSDGGSYLKLDDALRQAERLINEGADILDVGGESTRPRSLPVSENEEMDRVVPVIDAVSRQFDIPISIDTTKSSVARKAVLAGAEIINDISGLRFDPRIASVAAETGSGLVLMHSRGTFETMHAQAAVDDIVTDVSDDFRRAIAVAHAQSVSDDHLVLDVGIGFGKTLKQNLELLAKLREIASAFFEYPLLVAASRKSFIEKIAGGSCPADRFGGSLAAAVVAVQNGANILRVHDVAATVQAVRVMAAIWEEGLSGD